jgi:hypothetical protein
MALVPGLSVRQRYHWPPADVRRRDAALRSSHLSANPKQTTTTPMTMRPTHQGPPAPWLLGVP